VLAATALNQRRAPGLSVVVLRGNDVWLARGYGLADVERREPASASHVFQLGSIGKQFLAALVLRLTEQGLLTVDDPVTRHLPAFSGLPGDLRVRHLLSHTSGIREPFLMPGYEAGILDLARPAEELVDLLRRTPVDFAPGSRWSYSNANYMILALLVERLAAKPYEKALADEFFQPLGLTSLRQCTPFPQGMDEARGYVLRDGTVVPAAPENMNWIRGDGGLCGHALDVARWTRLLSSGRVISPPSYELMTAPAQLRGGRSVEYGFGLSLIAPDGRHKLVHNGAMLGFSTNAAYYPKEALTVVVLANLGNLSVESIERTVARRLLAIPEPVRKEQPLPSEVRQRLIGGYDIGVFPVHVVDRGDRLWLEMPKPGPTMPLRYVGSGSFVAEPDPDALTLTFAEGAGPVNEIGLFMSSLHWYGMRLP
jgi:CubicO group peptidase (beta-lactamase class C family)